MKSLVRTSFSQPTKLHIVGQGNGFSGFANNCKNPEGQCSADGMHQHQPGQTPVLVDDDVHVLEDEKQDKQRVNREENVHKEGDVRGAVIKLIPV